MSYVVVDIETTGLSRKVDRITEIAAVLLENGEIKREFQTLINPGCKIPPFITRLTGISDDMVRDAPQIQEIMPAVARFFGKNVFVAHNATFDYGFINYNAMCYHNKRIDNKILCTKKLANRLVPDLPSKRLGALCTHFNITNSQAHRAMADVHATVQVFNNFTKMLEEQNITTIDQIMKFERAARKKQILSN